MIPLGKQTDRPFLKTDRAISVNNLKNALEPVNSNFRNLS